MMNMHSLFYHKVMSKRLDTIKRPDESVSIWKNYEDTFGTFLKAFFFTETQKYTIAAPSIL